MRLINRPGHSPRDPDSHQQEKRQKAEGEQGRRPLSPRHGTRWLLHGEVLSMALRRYVC
jgi:hypothetical protein